MSTQPNPNSVSEAVIAALNAKGIVLGPCPICQTKSGYTVQNEITHFPATAAGRLTSYTAVEKAFACAVMVCNLCGHLVFLNLFAYGLDGLTGLIRQPQPNDTNQAE